ncbi:fumarylacetoacetate hydrolase family protein [Cryptosporangium sp. NPDC051539]|uniref:fumarylacetoacetate hydrolase family protein n=1 Tax=Cryptosporangium sp. NPDC051539 TaxID=3363962 RepID=UPI00379012F1
MNYALVAIADGSETRLGVRFEDGTVVQPPELKQWTSMLDLLDHWPAAAGVLAGWSLDGAPVVADAHLLQPITWPRKVLCAGVNYRRHIREMGGEVPGDDWVPYFFLKPPTTTLVGPTDPIVIRDAERARYDWEAELAVVIGLGGRDIPVGRALDHVAGYCVANDVTARGYHRRVNVPAEAFQYDWFASKAEDMSLPLGPGITPASQVPDPQRLRVRLWVNDELRQDESTADMICPVDELISAASRVATLEPGDVIATGTPAGVGAGQGLFLRHGDTIRVAIDGLGEITNVVREEDRR